MIVLLPKVALLHYSWPPVPVYFRTHSENAKFAFFSALLTMMGIPVDSYGLSVKTFDDLI